MGGPEPVCPSPSCASPVFGVRPLDAQVVFKSCLVTAPTPVTLRGEISWRCQSGHSLVPLLGTSLRMGSQPPASRHWPGKTVGTGSWDAPCEDHTSRQKALPPHPLVRVVCGGRGCSRTHSPSSPEDYTSGLPRGCPRSPQAPWSVGVIPPAGSRGRQDSEEKLRSKWILGKSCSREDWPADLGSSVGISIEPGHPQKHVSRS